MIINKINMKINLESSHFFRVLESIYNSNIYKTFTPELGKQKNLFFMM